ncbi:MAG: DUF6036 family nucleotidyltransferase [Candidatus Woesearchaeota archaeon]
MITIEDQNDLLTAIGRELEKPITAYAIGGTAMMFLGMKEATLDIDIVFTNEADRETFIEAITKIGYRKFSSSIVYGVKSNQPKMFILGNERFDLFLTDVIDFVFSENMQKRFTQIHEFGKNLKLLIAHPQDMILMKCATDRAKDLDDAIRIVGSQNIDWDALIEEAKLQVSLGRKDAFFELGEFLENIKKINDIPPKEALDRLYDLTMKELEKRKQAADNPKS